MEHDCWQVKQGQYQGCRCEDDRKDEKVISYRIEIWSSCAGNQVSLMFSDSCLPVSLRFPFIGKKAGSRRVHVGFVRASSLFLSLSR